MQSSRGDLQEKWRTCRFGAEVLRGVRKSAWALDPLYPLYPLVATQLPDWRRFALSGFGLLLSLSAMLRPQAARLRR